MLYVDMTFFPPCAKQHCNGEVALLTPTWKDSNPTVYVSSKLKGASHDFGRTIWQLVFFPHGNDLGEDVLRVVNSQFIYEPIGLCLHDDT